MQIMFARLSLESGGKTYVRLCSNSVGGESAGRLSGQTRRPLPAGGLNPYSQRFNSRLALTPPKPKPLDSA